MERPHDSRIAHRDHEPANDRLADSLVRESVELGSRGQRCPRSEGRFMEFRAPSVVVRRRPDVIRHDGAFSFAASVLGAAMLLCSVIAGFCAQRGGVASSKVTTNQILVTNMVLVTVTNYVVTTNVVLTTNGIQAVSGSRLPPLDWVPPADGFDWIQLKSGEWLKGEIKAMQDRKLEFDSDKLNYLTFDWRDVRQVRSARTVDVLFVNGEKVSGPVTINPEQVAVGGAEPRIQPRDELQSLTPGGSRERNHWSGKASLGLTLRAGNTESVDYNAQAHLQRRTPATRLSLDYIGNISSVDDVESANNHRVNTEFDLWLSRRFYLILPFAEYYTDPFQNLAHRLTVGVGAGYDLINRPGLEWNITAGPAFQQAWFESSEPGEPTKSGTAALMFGSRFDWDITHRIELILEYRGQYTSREVGETTHHGVATLSLELTKRFDLDVSLIWDRISNPKVGADGVEPKQDDFRLVIGLGVDF
jgi:putative salt-induced outer membrane protein YdiY